MCHIYEVDQIHFQIPYSNYFPSTSHEEFVGSSCQTEFVGSSSGGDREDRQIANVIGGIDDSARVLCTEACNGMFFDDGSGGEMHIDSLQEPAITTFGNSPSQVWHVGTRGVVNGWSWWGMFWNTVRYAPPRGLRAALSLTMHWLKTIVVL